MRRPGIDLIGSPFDSIRPNTLVQVVSPRGTTYGLLVFSQCRVDDAHVEEDLASLRDLVELAEGIVEFIVVVAGEGCDPGLDFLAIASVCWHVHVNGLRSPASETW